MKWG